jgi:glycerate 2-kinase
MIRNHHALAETPAHELALYCLEAGIEAAQPDLVVRERLAVDDGTLTVDSDGEQSADGESEVTLTDFEDVMVVGAGKAAAHVAATLEDVLGDWLTDGIVVTNDPVETDRVAVVTASHPVPDERGVEGARRVRKRLASADESTLVLAVFTGGGSALLPAPAGELSLTNLQTVTGRLVESGATIDEINAVRKHCSDVKGGQLARAADPASVVTLLFSDVVGDDPAVIASGPTVPDPTTYADALAVLERHDVDAPTSVHERLERGAEGHAAETPKAGDECFERARTDVLANGWTAIEAARETASDAGYRTLVLAAEIEGEAREAAKTHAAIAREMRATGNPVEPPAVVVSGGEMTVTVTGDGSGGPNCEFALSAARSLPDDAVLASIDTDGEDGTSDVAGAIVAPSTVTDDTEAATALRANDAAGYLDDRGALVRTGQTGTNVNDLRVLVVTSGE